MRGEGRGAGGGGAGGAGGGGKYFKMSSAENFAYSAKLLKFLVPLFSNASKYIKQQSLVKADNFVNFVTAKLGINI